MRRKQIRFICRQMVGYHHYFASPKFRFMGLISPVGQMGPLTIIGNVATLGHEQINDNWPGGVSGDVGHVFQALSKNVDRLLYPQTTMQVGGFSSEREFDYDHEIIGLEPDVGKALIDAARNVNVPVEPMS